MANEDYTFDSGNNLDLLGFTTAQVTALLQAITEAKPNPYRGMVIVAESQPNVSAGYAWQKRCLWLKASTGAISRYDDVGHAWVSIFSASSNINGSSIIAGTIPLTALTGSGASAYNLIRRNAGNTAWEFVAPSDVFTVGSLPVNRLQVTGIPTGEFRVIGCYSPNSYQPYTAAEVADEFTPGCVDPRALLLPSPLTTRRKFYGAKLGDTQAAAHLIDPAVDFDDDTIPSVKLATTVAGATVTYPSSITFNAKGQITAAASGTAQFDLVTPADIAVPAAGGTITPVSVASVPRYCMWYLVCNTADGGYNAGDMIELQGVVSVDNSPAFIPRLTAPPSPTITLVRNSDATLYVRNPGTGAQYSVVTTANWRLRVRYVL